jgi:hypothetical protein
MTETKTTVKTEQRFSRGRPCPICGGYDAARRGESERCYGFLSSDEQYAHCTREEYARGIECHANSSTFAHKLEGSCRCGVSHGGRDAGATVTKLRYPCRAYEIKDTEENLVAIHERYDRGPGDKEFKWRRRPNGPKSLEGLPVAEVPLYGSEFVKGWSGDRTIILVEGEKATEALLERGFCALGTVTGAKSTPGTKALEVLRGRKVLIWPDNDPDGFNHMTRVADPLEDIASSLAWYEWDDAPEKGDAADHPAIKSGDEDALNELIEQLRNASEWERTETLPDTLKIQVNNRHLRDVTADALEALQLANTPPEVFVRAGALVRVREDEHGTPQIQSMELNHVRGRLARVADFVRVTENGETKVNPPEVVVKDLMALSSWPFPALEAVVESPILRSDGSVFDVPGYDPHTRLFYRPVPGFECPDIPKNPSRESIQSALDLINEAIGEFPYGDASSAANTLGLMLTPLVRQAVNGPVPMALIDKPQAGTGGSLLAETIALIGTGRTAEMLGAPRDDEEWRKQITAKLAAGGTMVTVDNVEGALFAPSLARALTARTWTDRILGRSETVTVSQRATWIATGNNIILRGDLPRRCYWIRLDAKQSRPWQRENFRHPDLLSWVSKQRGELVGALLTIARGWFAAGKPKAEGIPRLGSFEAWTEIVGGMVTFAGIGGFLGNLKELYDKADEGNAEWEAFLEEWWRQRGEDPITVKGLAKLINEEVLLKDALPGELSEALDKGEGSFTRRLGKALAKRAGTRYGEDGLHIVEAGERRRAKLWSIQDSSGECEFVSFVSLYSPSASNLSSNTRSNVYTSKEKLPSEESETNSTNSQTHTAAAASGHAEGIGRRRLTEGEACQVQKLISEGMEASFARAAVIGEEA